MFPKTNDRLKESGKLGSDYCIDGKVDLYVILWLMGSLRSRNICVVKTLCMLNSTPILNCICLVLS